jgi:hypothetical protein
MKIAAFLSLDLAGYPKTANLGENSLKLRGKAGRRSLERNRFS